MYILPTITTISLMFLLSIGILVSLIGMFFYYVERKTVDFLLAAILFVLCLITWLGMDDYDIQEQYNGIESYIDGQVQIDTLSNGNIMFHIPYSDEVYQYTKKNK